MPDLNLMDEGGFEEAQTPAPATPVKKGGGGGGGVMKIVIIVVVLAVVGGGLWFANKKGWVKVPFLSKKEPAVAQIQEDYQQPEDLFAADTEDVSLLETPPVEEPKGKPAEVKKTPVKTETLAEKSPSSAEMEMMTSQKLSEMSGRYTIQVFALLDRKNAEDVVSRLAEAGYPAYIEEIPMRDANWHTVRIGKYPSRVEARKAVETFALELRSNYFIGRVKSN